MLTSGPGLRVSVPGRVLPKTPKMVRDATLLITQHYKVWIKGKVGQSKEVSSALPLHLGILANEMGSFGFTLDSGRQLYFESVSYPPNAEGLEIYVHGFKNSYPIQIVFY